MHMQSLSWKREGGRGGGGGGGAIDPGRGKQGNFGNCISQRFKQHQNNFDIHFMCQ